MVNRITVALISQCASVGAALIAITAAAGHIGKAMAVGTTGLCNGYRCWNCCTGAGSKGVACPAPGRTGTNVSNGKTTGCCSNCVSVSCKSDPDGPVTCLH